MGIMPLLTKPRSRRALAKTNDCTFARYDECFWLGSRINDVQTPSQERYHCWIDAIFRPGHRERVDAIFGRSEGDAVLAEKHHRDRARTYDYSYEYPIRSPA